MAKNTDPHKYRDQEVLNNIYDVDEKNIEVKIASTSIIPLPTGASTSAKQDTQTTLLQGIAGFTVTGYDYIALTYVAAGNGVGEIETAIFKIGGNLGTTIATLTLTYNSNNEISSVTKI